MAVERLDFTNADGQRLDGRLDLPKGAPAACALFAHCFTCGKDIAAARRIGARLAARGIAVLRFDFTGLGRSEGAFETTTFASNVADLRAAAEALTERLAAPQLLIGHSLGGAAVLRAAGDLPSVRAVATIGAPFEPAHVTENFAGALARIEAEGAAEVDLGGRPIRIGRDFVHDVDGTDLAPAIGALGRALLVLHAPRDAVVGIDNASRIFGAAKHPKSFVTLDTADHLISDPHDADYVAAMIESWASRYVATADAGSGPDAPEGVVRVREAEGLLQDIAVGGHHILADEPASLGGTDRGMTPYNLLSAALGACTSMTLRLYARRKRIALARVTVDVSHDRRHAEDAAGDGAARADRFARRITLEGDLGAEERARLLEIADRCPVHRTLERGAGIETTLEE